ncbi:ribosome biogenesis GTPase Der [Coralliovum pocilloporae]|uniref:ribosome biogenesis GTPase Der n=1 Tax=Coralliovum pocilloporae TaxID=3066369 RepID=UPI00330748CD
MSLKVAIIGRPNVGKSTLFNRLVGKRLALVDDRPGVTRDRREGEARIGDLKFTIIDTAGLEQGDPDSLQGRMRAQTEEAIEEADLSLFLVDVRTGVTPLDQHFADLLRKSGKPVSLIANKAEGRIGESGYYEAFSLGFGEPVPISAEHGEGMGDLYDVISDFKDEHGFNDEEVVAVHNVTVTEDGEADIDLSRPMQVAVVGRPNAGKSTLINQLLGEDRLLTGPEAGLTRDSIAVDWQWRGRPFKLFDTAGLRKKARVQEKLEKLSVADALRAVRFAEVVIVTLDATIPFEKRDLQIVDLVEKEGRAVVIALNKWDLIEDRGATLKELRLEAERLLPQLRGVPMVPISGINGQGLDKLFKAVTEVHDTWNARISTARLNKWLAHVVDHHPPPAIAGRRVKIRYMTQAKTRPPTFVVFCSRPDALAESYRRYLLNGIRETFKLSGIPLRVIMRKGDNPYDKGRN